MADVMPKPGAGPRSLSARMHRRLDRAPLPRPFTFPANMAFSGEMVIDGDVHIDHVQDGFLEARHVYLGPRADVAGIVVGHVVVVDGRVEGAIYGDRIVLRPSASVEGELYFRELSLASGVWFEGKSRRVENPRALANALPRQLHGLAELTARKPVPVTHAPGVRTVG